MFQPVSENAQGKGQGTVAGVFLRCAVGHDARHAGHFRNPATVFFAVKFQGYVQ